MSKNNGKRPPLTKEERAKREARRERRERTKVAEQRSTNRIVTARDLKGLADLSFDPKVGF